MTCSKLFFLVVGLLNYIGAIWGDLIVDTKVGLIRGQPAIDGDYNMFLGIPYAKVDEANPFGPSHPMPVFKETFEAFDDSAICPQIEEFNKTIVGTLDCLHLNIYVPTTVNSDNTLPVLVWIYGGAYTTGFAGRYLYGPKFLVRHDIILVTLNYRVGPYGFLCLDIPAVTGNQGLKDQQIALRWIKDNIEAFGGNPNKITAFGQSAGGKSIDFHIHLTEETLFQQAIFQSGSILTPGLVNNPGNDAAFMLAEHLGHATTDLNDALSFLNTIATDDVIASVNELNLHFELCVENQFDGVDTFLTDYPVNLQVPNDKNITLLIGCNNDEELIRYGRGANFSNPSSIDTIMRRSFDFDDDTFNEMKDIVTHFYFGDEELSDDTLRQALDLGSDFRAVSPLQRTIKKYFNSGTDEIFYYMFSYAGERNLIKYMDNFTFGGAAHTDEVGYLFDVSFLQNVMPPEDQIMVDRITTLWANFVKYGNPTPELTDLLPVRWLPATRDKWNFLNIDSELSLPTRPFNKRMAFLDLLYVMNEKYQVGYRDNDNNDS